MISKLIESIIVNIMYYSILSCIIYAVGLFVGYAFNISCLTFIQCFAISLIVFVLRAIKRTILK